MQPQDVSQSKWRHDDLAVQVLDNRLLQIPTAQRIPYPVYLAQKSGNILFMEFIAKRYYFCIAITVPSTPLSLSLRRMYWEGWHKPENMVFVQ